MQVVCGAPNARTGMKGVFAPAGSYIPGTGSTLKKGVIRGVDSNGMLCSMREMGLGDEHDGIIDLAGRRAGRRALRRLHGLRRSGVRHQADAEPRRLPRRARHRARPRRRRARHAEAARRRRRSRARSSRPIDVAAHRRSAQACPLVRRPLFPRREERPQPAMAAGPADGDRPAADLGAGRHHQLRHLRPQPAAARVRRRQGDGQSRPAHGAGGREGAGAERQRIRARARA